MPGRRWADGLHQAVEAKEGIRVRSESQTFASITFQNYFRMYDKLGGMTGTADTEAEEFAKIYNLDVSLIPTNRPLLRNDEADVVFKTKKEKFDATVEELQARHEVDSPFSSARSRSRRARCSKKLKRSGIKHTVLNAKQHEKEAEIVAQAGRKGAITISTNMAGRGTDILLGGNPEVMALEKCQHDKKHPDFRRPLRSSRPSALRSAKRSSRPVVSTSSAPSGTSRVESTISSAAAPVVRATPALPSSSSRSRTTCCGSSRRIA